MRHLFNIAHGIGAGMLCAFLLYLAGLVLTPRRWNELLRGAGLVILGAALYVLLCWIAIRAGGISLTLVSVVFAGLVLVLSILRNRRIVAALTSGIAGAWFRTGVLLFLVFYMLSYVMTRPPVADSFLPPVWSGNPDLITYARYARHLLMFGSTHIDEASFDFLESPAASCLLAGFSVLFHLDPLDAAMPVRFVLAALTGVSIVTICWSVFSLPMSSALLIACIFLTNPYFEHVFNAYLLPPLITLPVFLFLLWLTTRTRSSGAIDWALVAASAGAYGLLFLTDIVAFLAAMALQALVIVTMRMTGRNVRGIVLSSLISAVLITLAMIDRVRWSFDHLHASNALTSMMWTLGILLLAAVAYVIHHNDVLAQVARNPTDRRLAVMGAAYAVVVALAGNVVVNAARERVRMPAGWRGVEQLKNLHLGELTLKIDRDTNRLLRGVTRYFLPETRVHEIAPGIRIRDVQFETVSRRSPILIQNVECEGVGHADVMFIKDVGCVLFAPPTLGIDVPYPFNRSFLFLSLDGMSDAEPAGRWNFGRGVSLRLMVDPERTPVDRDLHVNLLMNPSLPPHAGPRRLTFKWGTKRTGEILLAAEDWISVPISIADWTGGRVRHLQISSAFPGTHTVLFRVLSISEKARGRLVQ